MIPRRGPTLPHLLGTLLLVALMWVLPSCKTERPLSPTALVATSDGRTLYVAAATDNSALELTSTGEVRRRIALPTPPTGLALSPDGHRLAVTCAAPASIVCIVDTRSGELTARWPAGHTAMAPVFSPDGSTLFVCNRFNDEVALLSAPTDACSRASPSSANPSRRPSPPMGAGSLLPTTCPQPHRTSNTSPPS